MEEKQIEETHMEKIVIDVDQAIQDALDKRGLISNIVVLVAPDGSRAELQSSHQTMDHLLEKAHDSLIRIKSNEAKTAPTYTE